MVLLRYLMRQPRQKCAQICDTILPLQCIRKQNKQKNGELHMQWAPIRTERVHSKSAAVKIALRLISRMLVFRFFLLLHSFNYQSVRNMLSDCCVRAFASTLFLAERLQNRPVLQSIFDDLFRVCVIWCDYIFYFRAILFSSVVSCLLVLNGCICAIVEHRSMSK